MMYRLVLPTGTPLDLKDYLEFYKVIFETMSYSNNIQQDEE
jgi:hypothetical protein